MKMSQRIFLGVFLPVKIKKQLTVTITQLKQNNRQSRINWVKPENLHITINFFGDLDKLKIAMLDKIISQYCQTHHLENKLLTLHKIKAFPNLARPRIIIANFQAIDRQVLKYFSGLIKQFQQNGFQTDNRGWTHHITLGRNKNNNKLKLKLELPKLTFKLQNFQLITSQLTSSGSVYNTLKNYKLS